MRYHIKHTKESLLRNSNDTSRALVFFCAALLMLISISMVMLFANSDLGNANVSAFETFRLRSSYLLLALLLGMAIYNQYVRKLFRCTWFLPIAYGLLCIYAFWQGDGRTINWLLGYINFPLVGISLLITFEYLIATDHTDKWIKKVDMLFLFLSVFGYIMVIKQLLFGVTSTGFFQATNNVYFVLPLLCYWMTKKSKWLIWGIPILMIVIALLSLKRGAIIATVCMACISVIIIYKKRSLVFLPIRIALLLIVLVCAYKIIEETVFHGHISQRFETIAEGAGRAKQFERAFEVLPQSSFHFLLVGHGPDSCRDVFGTFLHNDWLRLTYEHGLIGVSIFTLIFGFMLLNARRLWNRNSPYAAAWATCCVFCVCLSLYSAVTWLYILNVLPVMGCILGLERRRMQPDIRKVFVLKRQCPGSTG